MTEWPFGALRPYAYDVIVADPPWLFEIYSDKGAKKAPQGQYACMDIEAIKALPVNRLARASRPGWDVFGDEAGKFDGEAA